MPPEIVGKRRNSYRMTLPDGNVTDKIEPTLLKKHEKNMSF